MTNLVLDIETIPSQRPDVLEDIRASKKAELTAALAAVKAPGNYGAEAAAKWWAEKGEAQKAALQAGFDADVDDAYRRTGLDGAYGQVCVIGFAIDDAEPSHLRSINLTEHAERELLMAFADCLNESIPKSEWFTTTVIGHNVVAFDLRFLMQRHIVTGVRPHMIIARASQAKPWEQDKVYDTLVQWGGVGAKAGGSLDKLCKALSIPSPKNGIDGSKVWDFVRDGRLAEVADYCARDVAATRSVHRRMTFA